MKTKKTVLNYRRRKIKTNARSVAQWADYRCVVSRSLKHIYAQIVDKNGNVVVSSSDLKISSGTKKERASQVGESLAKNALKSKITHCIFDRNGYLYHGRVQALCEGAREGGLAM